MIISKKTKHTITINPPKIISPPLPLVPLTPPNRHPSPLISNTKPTIRPYTPLPHIPPHPLTIQPLSVLPTPIRTQRGSEWRREDNLYVTVRAVRGTADRGDGCARLRFPAGAAGVGYHRGWTWADWAGWGRVGGYERVGGGVGLGGRWRCVWERKWAWCAR
jgi:hypothetical protein